MLRGKKVVVIGGTSGMGLEVARQVLAQRGEPVVLGRHPEKLQFALKQLGSRASGYNLNIGDGEVLKATFGKIGRFDHLVTTAANLVFKPFPQISREELMMGVQSKLLGPFLAAQRAVPHLPKDGSILFFSGLAAYKPTPGASIVATVNAALEGLAKALAVELAPIRVNVISPGVVDTPLWDNLPAAERNAFYQGVANSLLVRRIGFPADLAHAAIFALTNAFLTGTVLHVDGGGRLS